MTLQPPTPEDQILFLRNIQRLLGEGQFTASYKFALLLAIADLCIVQGDDSGAPLDLSTADIAEKFIELYWQQCRPYEVSGRPAGIMLQQNAGKQASIIREVSVAQKEVAGSLFSLKASEPGAWRSLRSKVKQTINMMPLWKLQTVGSERLEFLYVNQDKSTATITLKPGVAYCFRTFYVLLRDLIQGAWVRFVQQLNSESLGNLKDLGSFLFGTERATLEAYRRVLQDIQEGRCFYCRGRLNTVMEVDHFVPRSRYPSDLGHNFVVSHTWCNNAKSDYLAAEQHLAAWTERNVGHQAEMANRFMDAAVSFDLPASTRIARWAYEQTEKASGQVWVERRVFQHLGLRWRQLI